MRTLPFASLVLCAAFAAGCGVQADDGWEALAAKHTKTPDAAPPPSYPDPSLPGVVACFTEGAPDQTCEPGVACNFNNYNSYHDGFCSNSYPQTYGLETCDGPEDCAAGSFCCVVGGWNGDMPIETIACKATACQTGGGDYEMCHPTSVASGTCSDSARSCVTALAAGDYSIAGNLYLCN